MSRHRRPKPNPPISPVTYAEAHAVALRELRMRLGMEDVTASISPADIADMYAMAVSMGATQPGISDANEFWLWARTAGLW